MKKRVQCLVEGRVQGVGFRYFTQELAMEHQLVGWVKNQDDGTVLAEAEGEEKNVDSFLHKLEKGNRFGRVSTMNYHKIDIQNQENSFSISH